MCVFEEDVFCDLFVFQQKTAYELRISDWSSDGCSSDLKFVKTTWAKLMDDFTSGKCDIGAGGISVSLARQQRAYFSAPYMVNGKTPITLCTNVKDRKSVE